MQLWTVQPRAVWRLLRTEGVFRAQSLFVEPDFRPSYRWMSDQLARRSPKPPGCEVPVWAWYWWGGPGKRKPDLRFESLLPRGTAGVLLGLEIEGSRVLLSDFELWHFVLNYWYLPASEEDDRAFERQVNSSGLSFYQTKPLPQPWHSQIERSWQRVFDLEPNDEDPAHLGDRRRVQAVFWELWLEDVRSARDFAAR